MFCKSIGPLTLQALGDMMRGVPLQIADGYHRVQIGRAQV